jgi:hypothetical protein
MKLESFLCENLQNGNRLAYPLNFFIYKRIFYTYITYENGLDWPKMDR